MARARKAASSKDKSAESEQSGEFTCPECGKTFERAAGLGAHRSRTHGVAGTSAQARSRRGSRAGSRRRSTSSGGGGSAQRRQPAARNGSQARDGRGSGSRVDRDALLQTLFPNGVPPREDVIRRANAWLDEAEQLVKSK